MFMKRLVLSLALVSITTVLLHAATPTGWYLAGSQPTAYFTAIEPESAYNGHSSAVLKRVRAGDGFGTLMQDIRAEHYAGKRLRFSAFIKTEEAKSAGLWMRVDKGSSVLEFDNMQDRPLIGTSGWQRYSVVLDVPTEATGVYFGILLSGSGTVWINSGNLEVVGKDVPTTGNKDKSSTRPAEPINLDFEAQ
jgi:hypothetical protein